MANKTPTKTSFSKDKQPKARKPRGKSERTKILESFKRCTRTEDQFYDLLTEKAFNPEDQFSFKELLGRMSPMPKAVAPFVNFEFDPEANLHEQSGQVLEAIAKGELPPDIGSQILNGISSMVRVKEVTDIDERLKVMEKEIESPE